jgi:hypothetical protein
MPIYPTVVDDLVHSELVKAVGDSGSFKRPAGWRVVKSGQRRKTKDSATHPRERSLYKASYSG